MKLPPPTCFASAPLRACRPWLLAALLMSGCASSPIDEAGASAIDDDEADASTEPASVSSPTPVAARDAGTPSNETPPSSIIKRDAGLAPVVQAGVKQDAGAPKPDAGAPHLDASTGATTPTRLDASASTTPPVVADSGAPATRRPDAAVVNPNAGKGCKVDADCDQSCLPVGVFSCCGFDSKCGCTWTPGIYCL
jgi:hypothetical protein